MSESHWYLLRTGVAPDLIVRDDSGESPGQWAENGRRRFPAIAALIPRTRSDHNKAPDGLDVQITTMGGWIVLAVLWRHPFPIEELPETHPAVLRMREALSGRTLVGGAVAPGAGPALVR